MRSIGPDNVPFTLSRKSLAPGNSLESGAENATEMVVAISGAATVLGVPGITGIRAGDVAYLPPGGWRVAAEAPFECFTLAWRSADPGGARVFSLDRSRMYPAYEMELQDLMSAGPFGSVFGSVPPHTVSKHHNHHDCEVLLVLSGRARVTVNAESAEFAPGDLVVIPPFAAHGIHNDTDQPFDLVSVYWEDIGLAASALAARPARDDVAAHTVVVCPPPTPNGGLHFGHAAGPYVRADVYARALRAAGKTADLVTGTDDHQTFVVRAAEQSGRSPAEVAREAGDGIVASLRALDVDLARAYRPERDPNHANRIRELFGAVRDTPAVREATVDTPWCPRCERSLYQAFAGGGCPRCGEDSDGEICEACGHPNDAIHLTGLACRRCGGPPVSRPEPAHLLDLRRLAPELTRYLNRTSGSGRLRLLADELIDAGLAPYRLTRAGHRGVRLPGGIVDPWVELALTQLAGNPGTDSVVFLGLDNTFYYAILLPALAILTGREHLLPTGFVANAFLQLDGEKFSTSRGHAIWVDDLLEKVPADLVRLAALRHAPETEVRDLSARALADLTRDPLLTAITEWLAGFRQLPGRVPGTGAWTAAHREYYRGLCALSRSADSLLLPGVFRAGGYPRLAESLLAAALEFRDAETGQRRIRSAQEESRTSVALEYLTAKALAALVHPVLPRFGARLWAALRLPGLPVRELDWTFVPAGTEVVLPELELTR
jgi:methionyl-tRNA synthetase